MCRWLILLGGLVLLGGPSPAWANGGPVRYRMGTGVLGSVTPLKSRQVKLVSETVHLDVYPTYTRGRVVYQLQNLGPATTLQFGFPTLVAGERGYGSKKITWRRGYLRYRIAVDGKPVRGRRYYGRLRGTNLRTFRSKQSLYPFKPLVRALRKRLKDKHAKQYWRYASSELNYRGGHFISAYEYRISRLRFGAKARRKVVIEFTVENYLFGIRKNGAVHYWKDKKGVRHTVLHGLSYFTYATWPARYWAGTIDRAEFRVRVRGFPWHRGSGPWPAPVVAPKPTRTRGATFLWRFKNYVPKANIAVLAVHSFASARAKGNLSRYLPTIQQGLTSGLLSTLGPTVVRPVEIAAVHEARYTGRRRTWKAAHRKAVDGQLVDTAWYGRLYRRHRKRRPGLRVRFKRPVTIRALGVVGSAGGSDVYWGTYWKARSRPKVVTVRAGSFSQRFTLKDGRAFPFILHRNLQVLTLRKPVKAREVEVVVESVYRGRDYFGSTPRVTISELVWFRRAAKKAKARPALRAGRR